MELLFCFHLIENEIHNSIPTKKKPILSQKTTILVISKDESTSNTCRHNPYSHNELSVPFQFQKVSNKGLTSREDFAISKCVAMS